MSSVSIGQELSGFMSSLASECQDIFLPPEEGVEYSSNSVINMTLLRGTRGYIERIGDQINVCYENACYDASAVMIRRLLETLLIEAFEAHGIDNKIKNSNGEFKYLADLIDATLGEGSWNLGRNTKPALRKFKDVGDKSAHSRRFNANRSDIDTLKTDLRTVVQELVYLARLK